MAAIRTPRFRARGTTGTVGGMFEYFTGPKYVWNLGVCATLNNGGGEVRVHTFSGDVRLGR